MQTVEEDLQAGLTNAQLWRNRCENVDIKWIDGLTLCLSSVTQRWAVVQWAAGMTSCNVLWDNGAEWVCCSERWSVCEGLWRAVYSVLSCPSLTQTSPVSVQWWFQPLVSVSELSPCIRALTPTFWNLWASMISSSFVDSCNRVFLLVTATLIWHFRKCPSPSPPKSSPCHAILQKIYRDFLLWSPPNTMWSKTNELLLIKQTIDCSATDAH